MSFQQTCGHQFSRDDRSQNLCSAAWSESMIRDITWLFRAEMLPEAGLTQHYMNSYLSATTPRWMENMGNCRRSPWQNLSSVQFTSFSTPITCQSLRGRRRALLESPSTKHAKNVTRTNHSAQWAGQKLKSCIYKQKMDTHFTTYQVVSGSAFLLTKAFTKKRLCVLLPSNLDQVF